MINLDSVMTFSEAAEKWGFSSGATIRKAVERNKFYEYETKRSGNVWLTTYDAMIRVFGEPKINNNILYIDYNELGDCFYEITMEKNISKTKEKINNMLNEGEKYIKKGGSIRVISKTKKEEKIILIIETNEEFEKWVLRLERYYNIKL